MVLYDQKFLKDLKFEHITIEKWNKEATFLDKGVLLTLFAEYNGRVSCKNTL